jgi:hypothetical protein
LSNNRIDKAAELFLTRIPPKANRGIRVKAPRNDLIPPFSSQKCRKIKKTNGKWGIINKTGKEVIPPRFDDIYFFHEGLFRVRTNGKW